MGKSTITQVTTLLNSEKVKERQEGLAALDQFFKRDQDIQHFDSGLKGKGWPVLFQAIFSSLSVERKLHLKTSKGSATALNRLTHGVNTLRSLCERASPYLKYNSVKLVIGYALSLMRGSNDLIDKIALNCVKIIRCLLRHTPHLDHMRDELWLPVLTRAFNVVLGDRLSTSLDEDELASSNNGSDEDELAEDSDLTLSPGPSPAKRKREISGRSTMPRTFSQIPPERDRSLVDVQIEFTSLIAMLLRSSSAPFHLKKYSDLPPVILKRLERFLQLHPHDTSMHYDYLQALLAVLSRSAVNHRLAVVGFALNAWDGLTSLWGSKNKTIKETLTCVFKMLLPFITATHSPAHKPPLGNPARCVGQLWALLDGESDTRWQMEFLNLSSLRLELNEDAGRFRRQPYAASTFRAGWHFDAGQALAWLTLELQADCVATLIQLVDARHFEPSQFRSQGKRARVERPLPFLLESALNSTSSSFRLQSMRVMLFLIDRHWHRLPDATRVDVLRALTQLAAAEEPDVQSLSFLCLAAVISTPSVTLGDRSTWGDTFTLAVRCANSAAICRSACHLAHALLETSQVLLSPQIVFNALRNFIKDVDNQGPSAPYDAVCSFIKALLERTRRDAHLHALHAEDKILRWLTDKWCSPISRRSSVKGLAMMPAFTVDDIFSVLQSLSGMIKTSSLLVRPLLPECLSSTILTDECRDELVTQYLLRAYVPSYPMPAHGEKSVPAAPLSSQSQQEHSRRQATDRDRKISIFLLQRLEDAVVDVQAMSEANTHITAEEGRCVADLAVVALVFEVALSVHGTQSTRRVIQLACKVLTKVAELLRHNYWTQDDKPFVLMGFDPLALVEEERQEATLDFMIPPTRLSGISMESLKRLVTSLGATAWTAMAARLAFQRAVWRSADVQTGMSDVTALLRRILASSLDVNTASHENVQFDDQDDFGFLQGSSSATSQEQSSIMFGSRHGLASLVSFLSMASSSVLTDGPRQEKTMVDICLECDATRLLPLLEPLLVVVKGGTLTLDVQQLGTFLQKLENVLTEYDSALNETAQLLVIKLLESTIPVWVQLSLDTNPIVDMVYALLSWAVQRIHKETSPSWMFRLQLAQLLTNYLQHDPQERLWSTGSIDEEAAQYSPIKTLQTLNSDPDIRVRMQAALGAAQLLRVAHGQRPDPSYMYVEIREHLCVDTESFEHMITRVQCLGNMMIASAAARRAPFWGLLEMCFHTDLYEEYLNLILRHVAQRLGLSGPQDLVEQYSSQLAFSIRQAMYDVLRLPHTAVGYTSLRDLAESTFRSFTPTNLAARGDNHQAVLHGRRLFANHCGLVHKSISDGMLSCFADIVGYVVIAWIGAHLDERLDHDTMHNSVQEALAETFVELESSDTIDGYMEEYADDIATSILRALGEQNFTANGLIASTLKAEDPLGESHHTFLELAKHRQMDEFPYYTPNLPSCHPRVVIYATRWLEERIPNSSGAEALMNVIVNLLNDIRTSTMVNEQLRAINSLCLCISLHPEQFQDPVLMRMLMSGAASLIGHEDLITAGQSILEWTLDMCRQHELRGIAFPEVLLYARHIIEKYRTCRDRKLRATGEQLADWMDAQVVLLCEDHSLQEATVTKALPAWPGDSSEELAGYLKRVKLEDINKVLNDTRTISEGKFFVGTRLSAMNHLGSSYQTFYFWRLKECMPPTSQLQDEYGEAFVNLLMRNAGRFENLSTEASLSHSVRDRHKRAFKSGQTKTNTIETLTHQPILDTLINILMSTTGFQSFEVYQTVRRLLTVLSAGDPVSLQGNSEFNADLDFFRKFPRPSPERASRTIGELEPRTMEQSSEPFSGWICNLATLTCDILVVRDDFFGPLAHLLGKDAGLAEEMVPILVHSILYDSSSKKRSANEDTRVILSEYFSSYLDLDGIDSAFLRVIVDTVLHLRNFPPPGQADHSAYEHWLSIDFRTLSRAAAKCGAYTTALLFLELAAEHLNPSKPSVQDREQILYEIYSHLNEPDGFYGVESQDMRKFLSKRLHHENQWGMAFRLHGAALAADDGDLEEQQGMLQSLAAFGFERLALQNLRGSATDDDASSWQNLTTYHLGWRTSTWDLPDSAIDAERGRSLYVSLRAAHCERDQRIVASVAREAIKDELEALRTLGDEDFAGMQRVVNNLLSLQQVVDWQNTLQTRELSNRSATLPLFHDLPQELEFARLELIMGTRMSLLQSAQLRDKREQIGDLTSPWSRHLLDCEKGYQLQLSEAAREANNLQVALNAITRAQKLAVKGDAYVEEEFSQVLWLLKEQKLAIQSLRALISGQGFKLRRPAAQAVLHARLGTWIAEAGLEKSPSIMEECFSPAAALLLESTGAQDDGTAPVEVYRQFAAFAQHQYTAIIRSPDSLRFKMYVEQKRSELERLGREVKLLHGDPRKLVMQKMAKDKQTLERDKENWRKHTLSRDEFLQQAIDMSSRALEAGDSYDTECVMRLSSLWFSNFDDTSLHDLLSSALGRVASYKFTLLAHQLAVRLLDTKGETTDSAQILLHSLVLRMAREHPYHTLYQISCLRPEADILGSPRGKTARSDQKPVQPTPREAAANDMFAKLRSANNSDNPSVGGVETMCAAALEWSTYPIKGKSHKEQTIVPETLRIRKLLNLCVPVPTITTRLDPTKRYKRCTWVNHYEASYKTAGGVNLPKISVCVGSNKQKYLQLFKGEGSDDMRQDAVIQQVFELANDVLQRDSETKRRRLAIRTYKVIPLCPKAGLLEFVDDTMTVANWLNSAHLRYRPKDMKPKLFSDDMRSKRPTVGQGLPDPKLLHERFLELRQRFQPVMRHYFTEKHKTPILWFRTRLNYTRSVATSSIVGHIIGLGDRHISNILLDKKTGEVVHIDLGYAFDQGRDLPVPERVPFRLTADMVDGMGTSGTRGVFQRCAEETLRVLRDGSETIVTVLEVFKHDPLIQWVVTNAKAEKAQGLEKLEQPGHMNTIKEITGVEILDDSTNPDAERVLFTVSRKLEKTLSVEYVVNELIAEATDSFNLANMFMGWSPHM